jgi:HEAT repeat protein
LQTPVRTLVILVACCGVCFWAVKRLWDNYDPVLVESRALQKEAIGGLLSSKTEDRLSAIQQLERLRSGDISIAITALCGALEDPVDSVRLAAAAALDNVVRNGAKSGIAAEDFHQAAAGLLKCAELSESKVRIAAIHALGSIAVRELVSKSSAPTIRDISRVLLVFLNDPEPKVRATSAVALGSMVPTPPVGAQVSLPLDRQALISALAAKLDDRESTVRAALIQAITMGTRGTEPPEILAKCMKDESADVRAATAAGLMGCTGLDSWVPDLLRLAEHDPDETVREHCLRTLGSAAKPPAITAAAVPDLIPGLKSKMPVIRRTIGSILGDLGADAVPAVPDLIGVLSEPLDPNVVPVIGPAGPFDPGCQAAQSLGKIGPGSVMEQKVIKALTDVIQSGPVSRRGWAATALSHFGPAARDSIPALIQLAKDAFTDDTFERASSAALALSKIAPDTPLAEEAISAVIPILDSRSWLARDMAAEALGRFGPKAQKALPKLRTLQKDQVRDIREHSAKAIESIETKPASP